MTAGRRPSRPDKRQVTGSRSAPSGLAADRERALALTPVSRETVARLDRFVALLLVWQQRMNLIAPSTEATIWTRHIADSLQLLDLAPGSKRWVDLGSGAGFPGVVIACAIADTAGAEVHLVESNARKAAFLREAVRETRTPATVHPVRIVDFMENFTGPVEIVTARALAPLAGLIAAAYPLLRLSVRGLFPKGLDVEAELTEAAKCWNFRPALVPSRTDPNGRIVVVQGVQPNTTSTCASARPVR